MFLCFLGYDLGYYLPASIPPALFFMLPKLTEERQWFEKETERLT